MGALCAARNVWRAFRFLDPLFRGASLLRSDIDARRRLLDSELAHQTKRVDALTAEVDAQARHLEEVERRARDTKRSAVMTTPVLPFSTDGDTNGLRKARAFVRALMKGLRRSTTGDNDASTRLLITIDDLERVSAERAVAIIGAAHDLLASSNVILVLAIDPEQLMAAFGGAAATATQLERFIQIPITFDAIQDRTALQTLAKGLLGLPNSVAPVAADASRTQLDEPLTDQEVEMLSTLAPIAGPTARRLKRFINLYRLARQRTDDRPAFAMMLALDLGGTSGELAAVAATMDDADRFSALRIHPGEERLQAALQAIALVRGKPIDVAAAEAAWRIARDYCFPI